MKEEKCMKEFCVKIPPTNFIFLSKSMRKQKAYMLKERIDKIEKGVKKSFFLVTKEKNKTKKRQPKA